jgi:transposase
MQLRFVHTPTENQHKELQRMTQQEVGRVAERARMVLLSARHYTVPDLCEIFEMTDDTIYKWFDRFDEAGPEGLFDQQRSGRPPELDEEAQREIERLLDGSPVEDGYEFTTWTVPLLNEHLKQKLGLEVSDETVRRALRRLEFVWRRPRWAISYEDPRFDERMEAIEAALERAQGRADGPTVLFEDEAMFRRLPPLRAMWMRRGEQARVEVPDSNGKFALYGVLNPLTGETFTAPYPKAKSPYTEAFLDRLMEELQGKVVLIWDQASWHTSQAVEAVIARYERLEVLLLPKRAPEENPIEDLWRHLKQIVAANLERSLDALKAAIVRFFACRSETDILRMTGLAA